MTKSKHSIGNDFIGGFYKWGLWITQLVCDGSRPLEAPKGCFQYYLESSGTLTSFNFATDGGQANVYLNNEAYRICIVAKKGACRIVYSAEAGDFGLEKFGNYKTSPYSRSGVSSTFCVRDFLRIPDGSASGFLHTSSQDRYHTCLQIIKVVNLLLLLDTVVAIFILKATSGKISRCQRQF